MENELERGKSIVNGLHERLRNSVTLKLVIIGIIVVILQIPTFMIERLNTRREKTGKEAQQEIFSQWGKKQTVGGPVLIQSNPDGDIRTVLPEELTIKGTVRPELRYRGIFQTVTYSASLQFTGKFAQGAGDALYFQLSDVKGLADGKFLVNGVAQNAQTPASLKAPYSPGFAIPLNPQMKNADGTVGFDFQLTVNGSEELKFLPLGRTTRVELASDWHSPGFIGDFLPQSRTITQDGFTAEYRINELNRALPQSWTGTRESLDRESFGVSFYIPGNIYLQTMRAIRYSALVIVFTMLAFFFTERLTGCRMHPVQYFMSGLAVVLFYVLLLSLGEHLPFARAYLVAALAVALAIGYYARLIFRKNGPAIVEFLLMLAAYGAVYVMLRMEEFALLTGTATLFVLLIVLMTLTGNLNRENGPKGN